jgi:hypothetical protein
MFSYADTTTGFLFFNFDAEFSGQDRAYIASQGEKWDSRHQAQLPFLTEHCKELLFGKYQFKYLHEWCHMLQMVWFPYRYVHTWKELTIAVRLRQSLAKSKANLSIGRIDLKQEWRGLITSPAMVHPIRYVDGRINFDERDPDLKYPHPFDMTELDLIENFASIFEYKCRIREQGHGRDYAAWLSNPTNKAYSNVFWFLADLWDPDFAYRLLPAIVQVSFYTDWVLNGFSELLSWLVQVKPAYEHLTSEQLLEVLNEKLTQVASTKPTASVLLRDVSDLDLEPYENFAFAQKFIIRDSGGTERTLESPTRPTLLTGKFMRSFVSRTSRHPLHLYAKKYYAVLQQDRSVETALFHPYDIDRLQFLEREFPPLVKVIRLNDPSLKGRDTLLQLAPDIDLNSNFRWELDNTMKLKDTAWSLATTINDLLPHQCHHEQCSYFKTNLCRRWSAIPRFYWHCGFPNWFSLAYKLTIDPAAMILRSEQEEVGMAARSLYIEAPTEVLEDFRKFAFDNSPKVAQAFRPVNSQSPGFQREPIVISLVLALGGPVVVKELCSLAKRYLELKHEEKMLALVLEQRDGQKRPVSLAELEQLAEDPNQDWRLSR